MSQAAMNSRQGEIKVSRRNNGTQLAGLIFLFMVMSTLAWASWSVFSWMKDPERLPLSRLVVTGQRHYTTSDDIRQAIMLLGPPGTFMTQNVNVVQQQIARLPWIQSVSVRKQWPDELKIHIVEYVPVARWNGRQWVDASGATFNLPDGRIQKLALPFLYGPEGNQKEVLDGYYTMNKILSAGKFTIKNATMSARRSWRVTLDNDVWLALGRSDQNKRVERLQRFIELYPVFVQKGQLADQRIDYVDLRYDTGVSVGWATVSVDQKSPNSVTD